MADLAADLLIIFAPTPDASLPVRASAAPIITPLAIALFLIDCNFSGFSSIAFTFSLVSSFPFNSSVSNSPNVAPISTTLLAKPKAYGIEETAPAAAPGIAPTPPAVAPVAAPYVTPVPTAAAPAFIASALVAIETNELIISSPITLGFLTIPFTTPQKPFPSSSYIF